MIDIVSYLHSFDSRPLHGLATIRFKILAKLFKFRNMEIEIVNNDQKYILEYISQELGIEASEIIEIILSTGITAIVVESAKPDNTECVKFFKAMRNNINSMSSFHKISSVLKKINR